MENDDDLEPHPHDELEEMIRKIRPTLREGDEVTRRQIAEAYARLQGDPSEENVQKQLRLMDWYDEVSQSTPVEKHYQIFGWFQIVLGMIFLIIGPSFEENTITAVLGGFTLAIGVVSVLVGIRKRSKRLDNLQPPS